MSDNHEFRAQPRCRRAVLLVLGAIAGTFIASLVFLLAQTAIKADRGYMARASMASLRRVVHGPTQGSLLAILSWSLGCGRDDRVEKTP
jgi:hypothetical protein